MKLRIRAIIFSLVLILNFEFIFSTPRFKTGQSAIKRLAGRKFPATPPVRPPLSQPSGPASKEQRKLNILMGFDGVLVTKSKAVLNLDLIEMFSGTNLHFTHMTALTFENFEESELNRILEPLKLLAKAVHLVFNTHYVANPYGLSGKDPEMKKQGDAEAWALREEIEGRPGRTLVIRIGGRYKPFHFFQRDFRTSKLLIVSLDYNGRERTPKLGKLKRGKYIRG